MPGNSCYFFIREAHYNIYEKSYTCMEIKNMSQPTNTLTLEQPHRLMASMQNIFRGLRNLSNHLAPLSISELLVQLEETTTPTRLTKIVNRIQNVLWKLPM